MNLGTIFTVLLIAVLGVILLKLLIPGLVLLVWVLPILLTAVAVISVVTSRKPTNTKLLWLIIVILAPVLGPLLWFIWGKNNS